MGRSIPKLFWAFIIAIAPFVWITTAESATARPLNIVIYGAGWVGAHIVDEAVNRGHDVTVVVRDPSKLAPRPHLTIKQGDVLDADRVLDTLRGRDVVVTAVAFHNTLQPAYRHEAELLVSALRALNPRSPRLIFLGGAGSLREPSGKLVMDVEPIPEKYLGEVVAQKEALDYLRTIDDVPWTYLSPAVNVGPGLRTGRFRFAEDDVVTNAEGKSVLSLEDLAVAVIDEAERAAHLHRRFTVGY